MSQRSMYRTLFSELLPPPRFLEMPSVGLDLSDEVIRFVELKRRGQIFEPGIFGEEKMPAGIVEEGYVKNKTALTKILSDLKNRYSLRFVKVSLPEEKAYLFKTQVPNMAAADIRGALQFKIEENVPVSLVDAVFDYSFVREPQPGDANIELGVAVIHSKVVTNYLDALYAAGLVPLELEIESQAVARAVIPTGDEDTYIIVAVRETKTILAIVSRRVIQYSSTISIGGQSIVSSIQKNFSVGEDEAQKIRQGKEARASDEMFQSLASAASVVRDEIQKLFVYWDSRSDMDEKKAIRHILVCGSDALLGIDDYLSHSLDLPVKIANVWTNVLSINKTLPPITYRESLDYASALGLALPYD